MDFKIGPKEIAVFYKSIQYFAIFCLFRIGYYTWMLNKTSLEKTKISVFARQYLINYDDDVMMESISCRNYFNAKVEIIFFLS